MLQARRADVTASTKDVASGTKPIIGILPKSMHRRGNCPPSPTLTAASSGSDSISCISIDHDLSPFEPKESTSKLIPCFGHKGCYILSSIQTACARRITMRHETCPSPMVDHDPMFPPSVERCISRVATHGRTFYGRDVFTSDRGLRHDKLCRDYKINLLRKGCNVAC